MVCDAGQELKTRAVILYWLVLLVATLASGALMLRLLDIERRQIAATRLSTLQQQARLMADDLVLTIEEAKETLLKDLAEVPEDQVDAALLDLERTHPLVRNAFRWTREGGLQRPRAADGLSGEQLLFSTRYQKLFSGQQAWPADRTPEAADAYAGASSTRQTMRLMAKAGARGRASAPPASSGGWITWFWEDQLYLLGWVADPARDRVHGVELEMAALLSRLAVALPEPSPDVVFAILDGNGQLFTQRGSAEITSRSRPFALATLGPTLPHWNVAIYQTLAGAQVGTTALGLAGFGVVAVLMLAILSAGSLLLWQTRRSLREARQRTSFVSNVSHELKTPLTTIRMYAEMLAEGRVAGDARRAHYLGVITRESQRLTRLVNNVLDFSRLEQGRKQYRPERLDMAATLQQVLDGQADRLKEAGLKVDIDLPAEAAVVWADRDAVEQAILNLLDNAVKYGATGGRLLAALTRRGAHWQLAIEDAGPGIPAAHRDRLFQQFHRVDDSLTAKVPGFGLGLSISRRLVEDQGGTLTYEPAAGGGARFLLALPAPVDGGAPAPSGGPP